MNQEINPFLRNMVESASQEQLVVILYDGLIQWLQMAKQEIKKNKDIELANWGNFSNHMKMAQNIIHYLQDGLDDEILPDFAEKLFALYDYQSRILLDANLEKNSEKIDTAIKFFQDMRKTWKEAIQSTQAENRPSLGKSY